MKDKSKRLEAIRRIIQTETISSQQELMERLMDMGLPVTQGSLSRYIKELNVVRGRDNEGNNVYSLSQETGKHRVDIEFSGNLAVARTRPGYAMGIASDIDAENMPEILATVAGDDTILIIPREGYNRECITKVIKRFII